MVTVFQLLHQRKFLKNDMCRMVMIIVWTTKTFAIIETLFSKFDNGNYGVGSHIACNVRIMISKYHKPPYFHIETMAVP